ncbi:hypothetical protein ROZALSC1DRAFT_30309 [Rozella allomycis CSF55]|uniref:Uncharacterized protein n=1 Tax=Rozella allomycis (strain CSF55) TaxID=988480 RepID=A0A075AT94_ROZAC|nr:hypothetical protein O9G_001955 [Rozella allomycis CSF55]RKP17934.1 hypothetical protein ROZALSC1DRAFT_30309 [Rozella allomycis CSF55]|eukprot:EPZ31945.1 hypothetical protein O9G_001955 [Rozella allomycis CSF55]
MSKAKIEAAKKLTSASISFLGETLEEYRLGVGEIKARQLCDKASIHRHCLIKDLRPGQWDILKEFISKEIEQYKEKQIIDMKNSLRIRRAKQLAEKDRATLK